MNKQIRNEYIAVVMSTELLKFCRDNDLPFESANDLVFRQEITDFQFGWLMAYTKIWDSLIEAVDTTSTN